MFGETLALLTAVLWSVTSIAFTEASRRIGSLQLNVTRMLFASIILLIIVFSFGFSLNINLQQLYFLIASGFAGLVFGDSFLFKSFQLIGARLGMLVMALVPAFSSLLAFLFLGESLSLITLFGITVTIFGIVIVILERSSNKESILEISKLGILYGVFGALGQAAGLILAKFAFQINDINGFVAAFIRLSSAVVIIFPVVLLLKRFRNPYCVFKKDTKAFKETLLGTIGGPVLGITFSLIAIANAKIGIASTLMSTVPIIMLPMVKIYYKEKISKRATAGAIIAVAGIAILFLV